MSNARVEKLLEKARRTNRIRDKAKLRDGNAVLVDFQPAFAIPIALSALRESMIMQDWDGVAEVFAMLEDYARTMHQT